MLGAAAVFIDSSDALLAAEHAVVHAISVEAGGESGRAHLEGHRAYCPDLNATTVSSPVCESLSLTTLFGFLDFRSCAV